MNGHGRFWEGGKEGGSKGGVLGLKEKWDREMGWEGLHHSRVSPLG